MWRQKLDSLGVANKEKKMICKGLDMVFNHPSLYNAGTSLTHILNSMPSWLLENSLNPQAYGHKMMKFPKKPFHKVIEEYRKKKKANSKIIATHMSKKMK